MKPKEPVILNFSYKIHGKPTECNVKKTNRDGEGYYMVCATIEGEPKEFPLHYDPVKKCYSFEKNAPAELKVLEENISNTIMAGMNG